MTTYPFIDVEWLTSERWAEILCEVGHYGEVGYQCYGGKVDWDNLVSDIERVHGPLPTSWEHPLFATLKATYRRAKKEAGR